MRVKIKIYIYSTNNRYFVIIILSFFKVVHAYTPIESDELDLRSGDYVFVSSEAVVNSLDGWVEGTSWLTGQSGLLPISYTERTAESDSWTLHKKVSSFIIVIYKKKLLKTLRYVAFYLDIIIHESAVLL